MSMNCGDPCNGQTITASNLAPLVYIKGVDINGCWKWESPAAMLCRIIGGLPQLGAPPPGVKFLGSDCKLYDPDAAAPPEEPLVANDSASVDFTTSGVAGHTLTAVVKISAQAGNQIVVNPDGIFVDLTAIDLCSALPAVPLAGALPPAATVLYLDGVTCGRAPMPAEQVFTPNTTATIQATPGGTAGHSPIYDVRLSALPGNTVTAQPDGLFVPAAAAETPLTANDSASVDFTTSGAANHTLTATVKVSALAGNLISVQPDGVFAAFNLCAALAALPVSVPPYVPGVTQLVGANCNLFTIPAAAAETPLTVNDSLSVDLTSSGIAGHTLTASINLSATPGNAAVINGTGVYVPDFCTQANAVDTATYLSVPGSADVLFVDAGGACARAPLPAAAAQTPCTIGALLTDPPTAPTLMVGTDALGCLVRVGACQLFGGAFFGSAAPVSPNVAELLARNIGSQCPMVLPARFTAADGVGNSGAIALGMTAPLGQLRFNAPLGSGLAVLLTPNVVNGSADVEYAIDPCNGWGSFIPAGTPTSTVGLDAAGCLVQSPPVIGFSGFSIKGDGAATDSILSGETVQVLGGNGLDVDISGANTLTVGIDVCEVPGILATTPVAPNNFSTFMIVGNDGCWQKFTVAPTCTSPNVYNAHALVWDDLQGWHFGKVGQRRVTRYLGPADSPYTILPREHCTFAIDNGVAFTLNLPVITNCDQTHFRLRLTADVGGAQPLTINAAPGQFIQPPTGPLVTTFVIFNNSGRETWDIEYDGTNTWFFFV